MIICKQATRRPGCSMVTPVLACPRSASYIHAHLWQQIISACRTWRKRRASHQQATNDCAGRDASAQRARQAEHLAWHHRKELEQCAVAAAGVTRAYHHGRGLHTASCMRAGMPARREDEPAWRLTSLACANPAFSWWGGTNMQPRYRFAAVSAGARPAPPPVARATSPRMRAISSKHEAASPA